MRRGDEILTATAGECAARGHTYGSNDALAARISVAFRTCAVRVLRFSLQVIIWKTCSMETSQKGISVGGVISRPCLSLMGAIGGIK